MIKAVKVTIDNVLTLTEISGLGVKHLIGKVLVVEDRYRRVGIVGSYSEAVFVNRYKFVRTPAQYNFTEVDTL